ncbi:hypothetical protein CHLRE_10g441350v5 [Chlamydomonas reinhardtii]|uniref:Uncharacterized protein n=1 Tax=Chlamydomonas reinhardtii TaxID=3055 RepID=A0A2K3DAI7_CHLRE|nr:uncharacterized protein CHLRE_10g441350v5 [Chlamydomonas reinhardtii]PNW77546.1 hypothetical protein CHLRE_10g441350v5 [Chlamydomonas reinhardtii]
MSELAGLSAEEAALINDVLTRLSIGHNAQAVPGLRAPHVSQHSADPELAELELAEQAIEQELRGLDNGTAPSSARASLAALSTYPYGGAQQPPAGVFAGAGAHRSTLPYSSPRDHVVAGVSAGGGLAAPGPNTAGGAQLPQPSDYGSASYGGVGVTSSRQATLDVAAGAPAASLNAAPPPQLATAAASSTTAGAGPAVAMPAQTMSLQEMREQLRRQQQHQAQQQQQLAQQQQQLAQQQQQQQIAHQQQQQQQVAYADNTGVSEPAPAANGGHVELAGPEAGHADGDMPSPRGPAQTSWGGAGGAGGGPAVMGAAAATPAASTASMAVGGARRVPMPGSAEAARAFTMLNARTSVDKYGHQANISAPFSASKVPVKLPEQERVTRLQQLYERTSQWRRRCEERYAKIKHDLESSALEGCTFSPQICTASNLIMQGKPPAEVYHELSKWATPTKHQQKPMGAHDRPYMAGASTAASSAYSTPARGTAPAKARNVSANNTPAGFRQSRATGSSGGGAAAQDSARGGGVSSSSPTPSKVVVNGPEVGMRMYNRATEQRLRQEERVLRQMLEEEQQRCFTASLQGVKPRVYNPPEPPSSRFLPTGMEECTFHPNSSPGQSTSRPKSAPHARLGTSSSGQRAAPPGRNDASSTSRSQAFSNMSTMGGSVHSTVSIRPDLDWGEFLARQERFLADREHKLALLEQEDALVPHMSPGSRRLLKEKEIRDSVAREEGHEEAGVAAQPSSNTAGSPGRLERKMQTIMEMYRECTFQPQITRKAAAMPNRSVDEMMDGGRSRRDEWLEQQRAVQQMRELEGATFKPQTNTKNNYAHVRPRINMRNPDAYLAHVDIKRRQREELRHELEREREALELQHCTFKPQVTPLPPYLIRRLQEQQLQQLQQLQEMQEMQELAMMDMQEQADEAAWGQADAAQGFAADSGGMQHQGEGAEEAEGVGADGGYSQAVAGYDPYLYGDLPAAREPNYAGMGEDPGISELDPEYQAAYQRALAFAMNQGQ